jgi:hypothetical protein
VECLSIKPDSWSKARNINLTEIRVLLLQLTVDRIYLTVLIYMVILSIRNLHADNAVVKAKVASPRSGLIVNHGGGF